MSAPRMLALTNFSMQAPRYQIAQSRALEWLSEVHAASEATSGTLSRDERDAFACRLSKLIQRTACGAEQIGRRGHSTNDLGVSDFDGLGLYGVTHHPKGQGTAARSKLFAEIVAAYFEVEYADEHVAPSELVHVTCTGYAAPSGAQRIVATKGWGSVTRVTHAYHMGCYAAFPAIRIAAGQLGLSEALRSTGTPPRADIVHTELCSLHLDPSNHSAEQCVVQSLFADGFIRYSLSEKHDQGGLVLLSLGEFILPGSADAMTWNVADFGMQMSLARDVPERITAGLRPFVAELFRKANLSLPENLARTVFALHPGGPKIIDLVRDVLELNEVQIRVSREVLFDCGNMSSATLPHVWMRLLATREVSVGTPILSLAFGPGLTVCGGLFRKI